VTWQKRRGPVWIGPRPLATIPGDSTLQHHRTDTSRDSCSAPAAFDYPSGLGKAAYSQRLERAAAECLRSDLDRGDVASVHRISAASILVTGFSQHGAPDLATWGLWQLILLYFFPLLILLDTFTDAHLSAFFGLLVAPHAVKMPGSVGILAEGRLGRWICVIAPPRRTCKCRTRATLAATPGSRSSPVGLPTVATLANAWPHRQGGWGKSGVHHRSVLGSW